MLRIGTWNVGHARGPTNGRRRAVMEAIPADIWVLTETHDALSPGRDFAVVSTCQRPLKDGVNIGSRWVSVWSRFPIVPVTVDNADLERTAIAQVETPIGALLIFGTVMPWRGDADRNYVRAIEQQAENWRDLAVRFPDMPLCVAGDFNADMAVSPVTYASK